MISGSEAFLYEGFFQDFIYLIGVTCMNSISLEGWKRAWDVLWNVEIMIEVMLKNTLKIF